jgi:twitching motility protein PilJ
VIVLPALPTVAWAAGALGAAARDAAMRAERDRVRLRDEVDSLAAQLASFAAGDLTVTPSLARGAEPVTTALAVTTSDAVVALRRLVRSLDATVAALATAAAPLAGRADEEAAASGDQGEAVGTTTSTVEQLAGAAAMIAELALRVAQCAGGTRQHVDVAATTVGAAAASVERIDTRVAGVDRRVRRLAESGAAAAVIDDLARRTEILAVNASIEAARAGEHGDGFRTVAGEVASHAARARVATASIDAIVAELRAAVRDIADVNAQAREAVAVGVAVQDDVGRALNRRHPPAASGRRRGRPGDGDADGDRRAALDRRRPARGCRRAAA